KGGGDAFGIDLRRRSVPHHGYTAGEGGAVKFEAVSGAVTCRLLGVDAAAQDLVALVHGDVDLGGVSVRSVAVDREPAGWIEEEGVIVLDGSELDAVDGGIFLAGQATVVEEGHGDGLALFERLVEIQVDRKILLRARSGDLAILLIEDL